MNWDQTKQIVQECALENMNSYPEYWNVDLKKAKEEIKLLANFFFENRNDPEVERDLNTEFEKEDYERVISWEWCSWINENKDWSEIKNVQDLFDWTGEDLEDSCSFERDLYSKKDNIFHPAFSLIHEDDQINFHFIITKLDGFNSEIEFSYCESI